MSENKIRLNLGDSDIELEVSPDGVAQLPDHLRQLLDANNRITAEVENLNRETVQEQSDTTNPTNDGVTDSFRGLPMSELIGAPLFAAADAQHRLAGIAWDFYEKIAFSTGKDKDGKETKITRILEFDLERPTVENGVPGKTVKQTVKAPFIGLVPIPSLLIDKVNVDFQMEVTDTNVTKTDTSAQTEASASAKWFSVSASVSGKVSTSRETTRTTNQTAKYQVHVEASQQHPTEGFSKLMDIMAACIEPIEGTQGGGGGGQS